MVLGHPTTTRESLSRALYVYDTIRRPMALQVVEKSRTSGHYLEFHGKALDFDDIDNEKQLFELKKLGAAIDKNWEWAWATSVDKSVEAALCMLES
jgi:salicylate hydroxylase